MLPAPARDEARAFNAKAQRLADPERTRRMDVLEAIWKGLRYELEGRPSFWDQSAPLRERAPVIAYPIARSAGQRLTSLVFGESRFPALTVGNGGADMLGVSLSEQEADTLTTLFAAIVQAAKLRLAMRGAMEHGLMVGTACLVCVVRNGIPSVQILPAKFCTPTFHPEDDTRVVQLDLRYHKPKTIDGKEHEFWYRRLITETEDRVWCDVPMPEDGSDPTWEAYESDAHPTAGFCPVIWARNLPQPSDHEDIDGVALFEGLEDEIEAVDFSLSQRHRNAQYNGEPQMIVTGASLGDLQGERGAEAVRVETFGGGRLANGALAPVQRFLSANPSGSALKKAPGKLWAIAKEGGDAKLLESTGAGAGILDSDANDLRAKLLEVVGVVVPDTEKVAGGDISAAALRIMHAPTLALCDNLRECWGDVLVRIVCTFLRMFVSPGLAARVRVPGLMAAISILSRFIGTNEKGGREWIAPPISLSWGEYFEPSWSERQAAMTAARIATGDEQGAILTKRTVLAAIAGLWNIDDVEAELGESNGHDAAARDAAHALLSSTLAPAAPDQPVADAAMNGAQVASLQAIITAAAANEVPVDTAREMILAAFPLIAPDRVERMLAPIHAKAAQADTHAELQEAHASLQRSHSAKSAMLDRVMEENRQGRLVQGSPVGLSKAVDPDQDGVPGVTP